MSELLKKLQNEKNLELQTKVNALQKKINDLNQNSSQIDVWEIKNTLKKDEELKKCITLTPAQEELMKTIHQTYIINKTKESWSMMDITKLSGKTLYVYNDENNFLSLVQKKDIAKVLVEKTKLPFAKKVTMSAYKMSNVELLQAVLACKIQTYEQFMTVLQLTAYERIDDILSFGKSLSNIIDFLSMPTQKELEIFHKFFRIYDIHRSWYVCHMGYPFINSVTLKNKKLTSLWLSDEKCKERLLSNVYYLSFYLDLGLELPKEEKLDIVKKLLDHNNHIFYSEFGFDKNEQTRYHRVIQIILSDPEVFDILDNDFIEHLILACFCGNYWRENPANYPARQIAIVLEKISVERLKLLNPEKLKKIILDYYQNIPPSFMKKLEQVLS